MKKIFIGFVASFGFISMSMASANGSYLVRSHRMASCSYWNTDGTCGLKGLSVSVPDSYNVDRIVNDLDKRVKLLEEQVKLLREENEILKNKIFKM